MIKRITTKECLEYSALELFSRNDIGRVTVKDICDNCNLSTRTFYKYYTDKYDVINTCFNSKLEEFFIQTSEKISIKPFLRFTAQIVNDNLDFYKNVFRYTGQNNIRTYLVKPLSAAYLRIIKEYYNTQITQEIYDAVIFYIQGQLAFVDEALTRPVIPDADASVKFFQAGLPVLLKPYW